MKKKKKVKKSAPRRRAKVASRPVLTPEIVEPNKVRHHEPEVVESNQPRPDLPDDLSFDLPEPAPPTALVSADSQALSISDPVARYMAEVNRYPLLTREQEEEVAKRYYETKDPRLAEVLVTSNLRFVVKVAAEYSKFGSRLIDLIQEGNVGLMHAVREFNPYKGVKLITYAVWWIRGYIQEYLMRQYSLVRIGTTQNQRKLFYQLQREKQELDRLGEEAGIKQISGRLGIPEDEVADMRNRLMGRDVSLSQPLGPEEGSRLLDLQSDDSAANDIDTVIDLKEHLGLLNSALDQIRPGLSEKETYILENRLLADEPLTLQEIGESWKVTREAVRQMEARLLSKIRKALLENGLVDPNPDSSDSI
ncbi:MAG: RNA polymerase factor sigma-32 [Bdellovibrionales bacterium]|nr:RNA polymerase factor sigma-32 [Bdellovibrionales bacterium]